MKEIVNRIHNAKHIVVIAHVNPDADSLGSASAMYTYLLTLHKKVSFFCATKELNPKLSFIPWVDKIRDSFPLSADLAISLDCGVSSRLGISLECDLINIDHHVSNTRFGQLNMVDSLSISTTQVLYNFFTAKKITINKKMATALYAGLLDDSDGFMSDDVDGTIFALSNMLIDLGADYKLCNKYIIKYQSLAALRIKSIMLEKMYLKHSAKVAVFLVSDEDIKRTGASGDDCKSALKEALGLPTVSLSLLVKENKDLSFKVSLRSLGEIDVSHLASGYGGGGHKTRAALRLDSSYSLQSASEEILNLIYKEI